MRKFTSVEDMIKGMRENYSLLDKIILNCKWLRWLIYNAKDVPHNFYRKCRRGWQRAYSGWADEDCWSLDYYLSKVIRDSVKRLRNHHCGFPGYMTNKEWNEKLDAIIYTFDVNDKILNDYWMALQKCDEWKDEVYLEQKERFNDFHVMTFEETERYERGWKYFQEYYFHLWD